MKRIILLVTLLTLNSCGESAPNEKTVSDECMSTLVECHEVIQEYEKLVAEQKRIINMYSEAFDKIAAKTPTDVE
jgi:transcription elongation factor Elf1